MTPLWLALLLPACAPVDDILPFVAIVSPVEGDRVCGSPLVVELDVRGITLVDPYDPPDPLPKDSAHIDCMLNGQDALMSADPHLEISGWEDGEYQLKVELSRADHAPLEPYAGDFLYLHLATAECDL